MNENKFTGKAELYSKYRPSYPEKLIDWLYEMTNAEAVADIGAGTGIFTSALLKKPWSVTAVEPNSDMLSVLKKALGDKVKTVVASAESTTLDTKSINLITVAQAFHWFDKARFKAECRRILTHDGHLAIVWNSRCQNSLEEERNKICMKYCDCYRSGHVKTGYDDFDGDSFLKNEYFKNTDFLRLENKRFVTKEQFIGDNLSRSYAPRRDDSGYDGFVCELENAFSKHEKGGKVSQNYITECYLGSF